MLAAPLALTRESLRPYVVGGIGWMDAWAQDQLMAFPVDCDLTALNVGGGAIGMLSNRAGLRFDLRRFKGIAGSSPSCATLSTARGSTSGGRPLASRFATDAARLRYCSHA